MGKQINGEGSVYFDKSSGKWIAALVIGRKANGTRMVKKTKKTTKTDATKALREMKQLFDTGKVVMTSSTSLSAFLQRWLEQTVKPNREPKTYGYYERTVRVHINPMLGRKPVTKLTRKDVQALVNAKRKERVLSRGQKGLRMRRGLFSLPRLSARSLPRSAPPTQTRSRTAWSPSIQLLISNCLPSGEQSPNGSERKSPPSSSKRSRTKSLVNSSSSYS